MSDEIINMKDIYKEFWECRNFEIEHLWQRSVFLGAFLLAIAAGYGTFLNSHIKCFCNPNVPEIYHLICLGLCLLGICFSQLWIMMAKGSKRWYERYEISISSFYHDIKNGNNSYNLFDKELSKLISTEKIRYFGSLGEREKNDSLLSTKGGDYSVSRINIFIGQLMCFVWFVLSGIHLYFVIGPNEIKRCKYIVPFLTVVTFMIVTKSVISKFTRAED